MFLVESGILDTVGFLRTFGAALNPRIVERARVEPE